MTVIEKKFSKIINGEHVEVVEIQPFQRNAPEYKCCCQRIHYTKGALLVALLSILISIGGITLSILTNYWFFFIPFVVFIVLSLFVFLGHKTEKKQLYLPYIIVMAILIISAFLFILLFIVLIIWVPDVSQNFVASFESRTFEDDQQKLDASRIFYAIAIVVLLVFIAIGSWFTWVVYKAYNFLRDLHIARNPKKFIMELKSQHGIEEIEQNPKLPRDYEINGEHS